MRVLVVGGSGLVGSLVLPALAQAYDVRVFDRRPPAPGPDIEHIEYVEGDLRDLDAVASAVRLSDALVFMAMGPKVDMEEPAAVQAQFDVAVTGLAGVLRAGFDAGIRHAVYTSSMSVYALDREWDDTVTRYPDESVPPDAIDGYGLPKRLGEEVLRAYVARGDGASAIALRLCFPVPDAEWPLPVETRRRRLLATSGRDVARAVGLAIERRGHGFEAYGISGHTGGRLLSIERAREVLGWTPLDPTDHL